MTDAEIIQAIEKEIEWFKGAKGAVEDRELQAYYQGNIDSLCNIKMLIKHRHKGE